jgi:hypothetical protein
VRDTDRLGGGGGGVREKGVTKDRKGIPVSTANQERQSSNAFHSTTAEQRHLRRVYIGRSHDLAARPKVEIETVFRRDQSASVSIRLKQKRRIYIGRTESNDAVFRRDQSANVSIQLK